MLKERVDGRITLSESDRVAQATLNASLGQPAHFQVYFITMLPLTTAATWDCSCSAVLACTAMSYQLLCVFVSDPFGSVARLRHAQRLKDNQLLHHILHHHYTLSALHHTSFISYAYRNPVCLQRPPKLCCSEFATCQHLFDILMLLNVLKGATDIACDCSLLVCCPRWISSNCSSDCSTGAWLCFRSAPTGYMRSLAVSYTTHWCCCLNVVPV